LSFVLAVVLAGQGVVQSFEPYQTVALIDPTTDADGRALTEQLIPLGPAASQVAIKQLGTNGGGFFNANSAHPLENPTPLSNFLQVLAILLIPAALCDMFGRMVGDWRQGWAILAAMLVIFVPLLVACTLAEQSGNPAVTALGVDPSGGNMEGKEVRFGIANSALWATVTTAASNGSVNAMHDSFTPLGGLVPMWLMQLGVVVFSGVGSGLYGMLIFAIVAVFLAGLMVGRTPEYLGKKIEAYEMKMTSLVVLIPPMVVLVGTAVAVLGPGLEIANPDGTPKGLTNNPGAHGFSEVLYAFSSAGNNNGSAFAGLNANVPFDNLALGAPMFLARYWLIVPTLAIAGALARKKHTPTTAGTLPTHTPLWPRPRPIEFTADVESSHGPGPARRRRAIIGGCDRARRPLRDPNMTATPLSLLERLRREPDDASWKRLFDLYTPLIRRLLEQQGMAPADAEDLGQEVWAAIHRDLPGFDHSGRTGAFRLWVRTIALNRLRGHWRSRSNGHGPAGAFDLDQLEDPDSPLSRHWDREHDEFVARRLMDLVEPEFAPTTWRAFRRQVLDGLSAADAARELGTTVNAVLIAKSRVLRRLREEGRGLVESAAGISEAI